MEKGDRKRPLESDDGSSTTPPPAYGSQEYWDERYKKLQKQNAAENKSIEEQEPDPFHAWYFTYEELAPIILPLIIGDLPSNDNSNDSHNQQEKHCNTSKDTTPKQPEKNEKTTESRHEEDKREKSAEAEEFVKDSDDDDDDDVNDDDDDQVDSGEDEAETEEESSPARVGLARNGPIKILEVGCGDVPLGSDIIRGIKEVEESHGQIVAEKILKSVTCIDYSKTVIDAMKSKQKSEGDIVTPSIPLEFACEDGRKLPFPDEQYHFILEKGTMDAMLSDPDKGTNNCRSIVAEMARVVARGGAIMIVSHINAHTEKGINWLNDIVVPGLQAGSGKSHWNVEVHGGDVPVPDSDGEDDEASVDPGPAVYIIHKGEVDIDQPTIDDSFPPTVPLRFFSY